jgi:hypothetical protein
MRGKKRLSDAEKWYFHLMNDPKQYEKETFVDHINEINFIIKEKIQTEYEMFKKYKMQTSISK